MVFSKVKVAECPPFGKELLFRLSACSPCIMPICNFGYFPFEPRREKTVFLFAYAKTKTQISFG